MRSERFMRAARVRKGGSVSRGRDAILPTSGDNGGILDAIFINSGRFAEGGRERGAYFLDCQRPLTLTLIYILAARTGMARARRSQRGARVAEEEAGVVEGGGGRVINYKALEGRRRRPTTGGCAARRMCKGMIMPNGEILPAGPGITWTRARPCSNLFDRVSYFSARSRPRSPWKKSFARRAMRRDATRRRPHRRCFQVLLTSSSRRSGGRENGSRENTGGPNGARHARTTFIVYLEISSTSSRFRASRSFRLLAERLLTCREKFKPRANPVRVYFFLP